MLRACGASLLGHADYRTTLATLIHDRVAQPAGLGLLGQRSFNLGRVRNLERERGSAIHHRVAAVLAICAVPLIAADVAVETPSDGSPRAELHKELDSMLKHLGRPGILSTEHDGLVGYHFGTTGFQALKALAESDVRTYYLHPDVADSLGDIEVTVAGTRDEVVRDIAGHLGVGVRIGATGVVLAAESALSELDWIDRALVLSGVPDKRVRLDIDLELDGEPVATQVDLVLGMSSWTGLEVGGCRISMVAWRIDEDGVDLELRAVGESFSASWTNRRVSFSERQRLVGGGSRLLCTDGKWKTVSLHATAHRIDRDQLRPPAP